MELVPGRLTEGAVERREETFTGTVWGDLLLSPPDGPTVSTSYFTPGSRTHWHRHEGGQILHVTAGAGVVAVRDGDTAHVRAGDVVWTPPGEVHWHGATDGSVFVHTSVSLGSTEWLGEASASNDTTEGDES